jgi:hypothetical protein
VRKIDKPFGGISQIIEMHRATFGVRSFFGRLLKGFFKFSLEIHCYNHQ